MVARIGGLAADADAAWLRREDALMADLGAVGRRLAGAELPGADGVAVLTRPVAAAYGVSGPAARASGIALDLRTVTPGLAYDDLLGLLTPTGSTAGDATARFRTLAHEVEESARLVQACAARLADLRGPVEVPLGKVVKLPEGEAYLALEAPLGLAGFWVVSRGEKTPWRFKLRTPSFSNVAALESVLVGVPVTSLEVALASIGYVIGDVDR
jgi:NADH-quinone oxidoreductase subunit D